MTAPTVRQIRSGMASRLETIDGLRVFDTVPGQFSPPAGIVGMPSRPETESFQRGTDRWDLTVWIVVARQADAQSEQALEQFLDPTGAKSVRSAVYGDKTLGGTINDIHELEAVPTDFVFGSSTRGRETERRYIGLEFTFHLLASGKP